MSVTVTRDPRGVRVLVVAPGPQGVKGDQGDQGETGPMPVVGTAAARDVPEQGKDATSAQVVLGSDTRLTDARDPRAHTHPVAEVTGLDTALAGKAAVAHTHDIDDVDALPALLDALALEIDGCAPASHTHNLGQVTGLDTALAGKAASKHAHVAAEVTDLGSAATRSVPGAGADAAAAEVVLGSDSRLVDARTPTSHQHPVAQVTGLGSAATRNVPAANTNAGSAEVVLGADTRLTNSRPPTAHAATHQPGGSDELPALLTLGNRLTWAEWTAAPGSFAPVACTATYDGAGFVLITATATSIGGGWAGSTAGGRVPVTPGTTVTASTLASIDSATAARDARMRIYWWPGAALTQATTTVVPLGGGIVELRHTAVAPPGTTAVSCFVNFSPVVVGEKFRLTQPALWIGAGGEVRPPGEPIPGLGWQRRSPAGGVDWVLERWDGTQWVLDDGDSGPRAVGASGRAHRRGWMVTWTATDVAAPVGWRDGYNTGQKSYMTPDPWPTGALPGVPA